MATFLLDLLPVIVFFAVYKTAGLMPATAAIVAVTLVLALVNWVRTRTVNRLQLGVAALVAVFGGLTLAFDDPQFIKWKPTIVYWLFAAAFVGARLFAREPLLKRLLGAKIALPDFAWARLTHAWVAFFVAAGALNLWVAYTFSTDAWVNFKLVAAIGLPLVFALAQGFYIARHATETP